MVAARGAEAHGGLRDGSAARTSSMRTPLPSLGCVGPLSFKDTRRNRSPTGLDESIFEKLDRLRISSPKVLPKMRGFTSLASGALSHGTASHGRTSPSILIRRTKNPTPVLSIDPSLASGFWGAGLNVCLGPMAPRSDGSSANHDDWRRRSVVSSLDSDSTASLGPEGGDTNHRQLFLDA